MERNAGDTKFLEGHSPVNKYDLMALEQSHQGVTEERMVLAFQALDELIPQLGVFTRIFRKLREDFFEAVYSEELTGSNDNKDGSDFIQRIPYFILVKRVYNERHEQSEELKEQLEIVKERLFDKHRQFEESQNKVVNLEDRVSGLIQEIGELGQMIADKNAEIERLEELLAKTKEDAGNTRHQLECDVEELQETLDEANSKINYLLRFKKGYDDLSDAFTNKPEDDNEPRHRRKAVVSTRRANLVNNIESGQKLEEQILTVINTSIEEFDRFLEDHKKELEEKVVDEDMTDAEFEVQEMEIDEADQQLEAFQERFKVTITDTMTELELLRQHNTMLIEQLQILEENKPVVEPKKESKNKRSPSKQDSILSAGLGDNDVEDTMVDPFIPQERVFSKYAAMIYTSNNNGKTFEEFKDARFCASCGEKTVICPHKLGGSEKVFILPHNCSHLKLSRPKVRINREFVQEIMKPRSSDHMTDMALMSASDSRSQASATQSSVYAHHQETAPSSQTPATSRGSMLSLAGGESYMLHTMQRLWDDFRERTNIERTISRALSLERTMSLMKQFFAFLVWQDDFAEVEEGCYSILDNLYRFFTERYLLDDVVYMCAHDFLSSVIEFSNINKMVQLLGHALVGNIDGSCLRYVLLMSDFICDVDWREVEDFRAFASAVYPFLGEDDLETVQMSYQSFSENKISAELVTNFIIHIILKYREPRFLELENRLLPFQVQEVGQLTEKEFKDALENTLPLSNEKIQKRLYLEAELSVVADEIYNAVPIMRLAQISGFLALHQITNIIKDSVFMKITEWRERPTSAGSTAKPIIEMTSTSEDKTPQMTLSVIKLLASNISRRSKHRQERLLSLYEEDW